MRKVHILHVLRNLWQGHKEEDAEILVHGKKVLWYGPCLMALWGMHWPPGTLFPSKTFLYWVWRSYVGQILLQFCPWCFIVIVFAISWKAPSRVFEWSDRRDFMTLLGRSELWAYWHNDQDLSFCPSNISLAHTAWSRCSHNVLARRIQLKRTSCGQMARGVCHSTISESYQSVSVVTEYPFIRVPYLLEISPEATVPSGFRDAGRF